MSSSSYKVRRSDVNSGGAQQPTSASHHLTGTVGSIGGNLLSGTTNFTFAGFSNLVSHPDSIRTLSVMTGAVVGQLQVNWTAPIAYGSSGTAAAYRVKTSAAPILTENDFISASTFTQTWVPLAPGATEGRTVTGLASNTTYYVNVKAADAAGNTAYVANSSGASTLTNLVTNPKIFGVVLTSVTVNWIPIGAPGSEGYELDASTSSGFATLSGSSVTVDVAQSTLTITGLVPGTTYFFRVGGLNWDNVPNFVSAGSTVTQTGSASTLTTITSVYASSIAVQWALSDNAIGYDVEASSTGFSGAGIVYSSVTNSPTVNALTVGPAVPLIANTTYFLRVGASYGGAYLYSAPVLSTSTLTNALAGVQYYSVGYTSITVNWQALTVPPGSEGYELDLSTSATFVPIAASSVTTNVALSTLTIASLPVGTTYYARVGGVNWNHVANSTVLASTVTRSVGCALLTSQGTGLWSTPASWDLGVVPGSCNPIEIPTGSVVTVDIDATASTSTIDGTLSFSRVQSSTLTVAGGNVFVNAGGTLDMGTSLTPLTTSSATLILAYGQSAGQYGLIVNNGGNFTIYGAAKTPSTMATGGNVGAGSASVVVADATGWQNGDTVTIDTEAVVISGLSGNSFNVSGLILTHYSTNTIRVNDLTRNVLVRSSGTTIGAAGNSAYVQNLAQNTTSFNVNNGEFAYLGESTGQMGKWGLTFDTASHGSISSSTIRNAWDGIHLNSSNGNQFNDNNMFAVGSGFLIANSSGNHLNANNTYGSNIGIYITASSNNTVVSNNAYSNVVGIFAAISANNNFLSGNNTYLNTRGIYIVNSSNNNTVSLNNVYGNSSNGILVNVGSNNNIFIKNNVYLNVGISGIALAVSSNNTLIENYIYSNGYGISLQSETNDLYAGGAIGYSPTAVASPDTLSEIFFVNTSSSSLIVKNALINSSPGVNAPGFAKAGSYLVNYSTAPGVAQVYGDYAVTGSTITLDYANRLYTSTTTVPVVMAGSNAHTVTSIVPADTSALNELITVTATDASHWSVTGSSSGVLNSAFACSASGQCAFASAPVNFMLNPAGVVTAGDQLNFATLAASNDASIQKSLQFGKAAAASSTWNNNTGRSRLRIDSTGGFHAVGVSTSPTLVTELVSGGTYYMFVDSGAFTVQYASVTDTDENGVWLSGSGPFSINNSTFDYAGSGKSSTSTLFTLNAVTQSTITLNAVTYGNSAPNTRNYNYTIFGSSVGLLWTNQNFTGALTNDSKEQNDTGNHIVWSTVPSYYWIANVSSNWNNSANWSATSGGISGVGVPMTGSAVFFDGNGVGSCAIDGPVNVSSITVSGYPSTIDTSSNTISVAAFNQTSGTFFARASAMTVSSAWTSSVGQFNAGASTVTLAPAAGSTVTISGVTTFSTLRDVTPNTGVQFQSGSTTTVTTLLTLAGSAGSPVYIRSSVQGIAVSLAATGSNAVTFVDVQDNNATLGTTIAANDGTSADRGDNTNWNFGNVEYWIASSASNWNNAANWSTISGGPGGATPPTTGKSAIFDHNGLGNCTIDVLVTVSTLTVSTSTVGGYTGAIDTSSNTIVVSTFTMQSGTFAARASSITVAGLFSVAGGSFNAGTSTVTLNSVAGSTVTLLGSTSFYTLVDNSPASALIFQSGSTTTVTHLLMLDGAAGNLLSVRSTSAGVPSYLVNSGTNTVTFVNTMDNNASNGSMIQAGQSSVNSGNNVNWNFGQINTCQADGSIQTGPWSSAATWSTGFVPTFCNAVTIAAPTVVTVDVSSATSSTMTVSGTLSFSRAVASTMTVVGGNVTVVAGGTLDLGTPGSPITTSAALILAYGKSAGQYGLILNDGSTFTSYGVSKWPYGVATAASGTSLTISASSATAWNVGDTITIGQTEASTTNQTETRTVSSISGGNPLTLSWTTPLTYVHMSTSSILVADLTRNVVVRSSGTTAATMAYVHSLATNTTSFSAVNTEFVALGANASGKYGLTVDGVGGGLAISSSSVHNGYDGVSLTGSASSVVSWTIIHGNSQTGFVSQGSTGTVVANTVLAANGSYGLSVNGDSGLSLSWSWGYSNHLTAIVLANVGSYSIISNVVQANALDGIDVLGSQSLGVTVSSNTSSRNNAEGLYFINCANEKVVGNTVVGNGGDGIGLNGSNFGLISLNAVSGNSYGISLFPGSNNLISSNTVSNSVNVDLSAYSGSQHNVFVSNTAVGNPGAVGIVISRDGNPNNLIAANSVANEGADAVHTEGSGEVFIGNIYYGSAKGIFVESPAGTVDAGDVFGYDASGTSHPDTSEVSWSPVSSSGTFVIRGATVNPSHPVDLATLIFQNAAIASYDQNGVPGTLTLWGDDLVSGSTLALDYANALYASTATAVMVVAGSEPSTNFTVNSTNDANALNQAISVQYSGSAWVVTGSSSTGTLCTLSSGSSANCPSVSPQFNLSIGVAAAAAGDTAFFGLLAASNDANVQKRLNVGPAASSGASWNGNSGRSRIRVDSTAAFHAVGTPAFPTVITALASGGTYYTFVDSGAFTLQYASVTYLDENGIQLSNSGPFSINNSTFDYSGSGRSSTSTLFSLESVVSSSITLSGVTYGNSSPNVRNYNYTISGSSVGVLWTNQNFSGALAGDAQERNDTANLIVWGSTTPPTTPQITSVSVNSLSVTFGPVAYSQGYVLAASTGAWPNNDSGNQTAQTSDPLATSLSFAAGGLLSNTTYFVQVGNLEGGVVAYANTVPSSTATLTAAVTGAHVFAIYSTSVTVQWNALPQPPGSEGYILDASTSPTFVPLATSSATTSVSASTLTLTGLETNTTYYLRVGGVNWSSAVNDVFIGSAQTTAGAPVTNASLVAVMTSSITVTWTDTPNADSYDVEASSTNFSSGTVYSSSTLSSTASLLSVGTAASLTPNTTYWIRVGALFNGATAYAYTTPSSTSTLTALVSAPVVTSVGPTAITAAWTALSSAEGYRLQVSSTDFNGTGVLYSTVTASAAQSSLTLSMLIPQTTYYLRVGGLNWNGLSNDEFFGSTVTAPTPIPAGFGGIVLGVSSITWTWTLGAADSYNIYYASAPTVLVRGNIVGSSTTETGLAINASYGRVLSAVLNSVESGLSASATVYTFAAVPGPIVASAVSYTSFTVTWASNSNPLYTPYEISISTDSTFALAVSTPVTFGAALTASSYTLTNLSPLTTYYVRVRAENGDAMPTAFSALISTTTLGSPPPTNFTGVAVGVSSITWSWTAVAGASAYNIYEASSTTTPIALGVTFSSYTETGLSTNSLYGAFATSIVNGRESAFSGSANVYTQAAVPSVPTFSTVGYSSFTIAWAVNGNPSGTRYQISESLDPLFATGISTPVPFGSLASATTIFLSLVPQTTYYLRVQAENGDSLTTAFSLIGDTLTLPTPPPTGFAGIVLGVSSITWTWNPVPGASLYRFYNAATATVLQSPTATGVTETGLASNTSYSRSVSAVVNGVESVVTSSITLYTFAAVPGGPLFSDVAYTSFTATWFDSGNPPTTPYEVSLSTDPAFALAVSTPIPIGQAFTGTTTTFVSLVQNTLYYVRERARNGDGIFTAFSLVGSTHTLQPPTPSQFAGAALGISSISWTWNAVPTATAYNVYETSAPSVLVQTVLTNQYTETGLATNQSYGRFVTAVVSGVQSFPSNSASVFTLAAAPTGSMYTSVAVTSVALLWNASGNPAGTPFHAMIDTLPNFAAAGSSTTLGTNASFSSLTSNTTYYVRVKATNGDGIDTAYDVTLSTLTPAAIPTSGAFTVVTSTRIGLSWAPSTNAADTQYQADLSTISIVGAASESQTSGALATTITPLIPDTVYYARVKALGWAGADSAYDFIGSTLTPLDIPTALTITQIQTSSMTLSWSAITAAKLVFDVELLQNGSFTPLSASTPSLTTVFTGLTLNSQYSARVRVRDTLNNNSSPWSSVVAAYTLAAAPVDLSTTAVASTSVSLMWDASGNPGSTLYSVERSSDGVTFSTVDTLVGNSYTDIRLQSGTVYLYRVRAINGDGIPTSYAGPIMVKTLGVPTGPKKPTGLWGERTTALGGSFEVTYRWRRVTERTDGSALTNLAGYQVFASSSLFTPTAQWTQVATVTTESWSTVTTDASIQYYVVRAVDTGGMVSDFTELMDDSVDLNHFFLDDDMITRAEVPQTAANVFRLEKNRYGADLLLEWTDVPSEEVGRVVRSVTLKIINTATQSEVDDLVFDPPVLRATMAYSVVGGKVVAGAPSRTTSPVAKVPVIDAANAASQLSLFRFNGATWVKSNGIVNAVDNTLSITTSQVGRYQIRAASHAPGITLTQIYPRIITPNGDGWNDKAIFQFDNPQLSSLSGMIYDITGAKVADLKAGPVPSSTLLWDGKDANGTVVPSGIYVYQVAVDGSPATGTIVVAR